MNLGKLRKQKQKEILISLALFDDLTEILEILLMSFGLLSLTLNF